MFETGRTDMAWKSTQLIQVGNSTATWTFTGGSLSSHDVIVPGLEAGAGDIEIERITSSLGPSYTVTVRVSNAFPAPFPVIYRLYAEQIN